MLGFDRFRPPHSMGSSHGGSRMIREAYYQGSLYVPLVQAAYESWRELERRTGQPLMHPTGGLMIGPPGGRVFAGCLESARDHALPYEVLSPVDVRDRFPAFRMVDGTLAVFEPTAGILDLDACLRTSLEIAQEHGARLRYDEPVESWIAAGSGVRIVTARGEYRARRLILAAGAWTDGVSGGFPLPLEVERTVQFWFEPASSEGAARLAPPSPVWVWEIEDGDEWYGFPLAGGTVKAGIHLQAGRTTTADGVDRVVSEGEKTAMAGLLGRFLPDADGPCVGADVCLYTSTPDRRFVIDRHPRHPEVALFTGGSGHAFKFARVLGEILADLATDRAPRFDLSPFAAGRFGG